MFLPFPFPSSLSFCRHFTAIFAVDHTRAQHHRILAGQLHAKSSTAASRLWWCRRRCWRWWVWRRGWLWEWHHAGAYRATRTRVNIRRNGSGQDLRVRQKQHVHPNGRRHHTDISIKVSGRGRERQKERERESPVGTGPVCLAHLPQFHCAAFLKSSCILHAPPNDARRVESRARHLPDCRSLTPERPTTTTTT